MIPKLLNILKDQIITENKACGTDMEINPGFLGFPGVNDDKTMRQIGGVSLNFFFVLLGLIEPAKDG